MSETEAKNLDLNSEVQVQADPTILSGQGGSSDDSDVVTKALLKDLETSKNSLGRKAEETLHVVEFNKNERNVNFPILTTFQPVWI